MDPVVYKRFDPIEYYIDYGSVFLYVVIAQAPASRRFAREATPYVRKQFERGLTNKTVTETSWLDLLVVTRLTKDKIHETHRVCKARHEHFIERKRTLDK